MPTLKRAVDGNDEPPLDSRKGPLLWLFFPLLPGLTGRIVEEEARKLKIIQDVQMPDGKVTLDPPLGALREGAAKARALLAACARRCGVEDYDAYVLQRIAEEPFYKAWKRDLAEYQAANRIELDPERHVV